MEDAIARDFLGAFEEEEAAAESSSSDGGGGKHSAPSWSSAPSGHVFQPFSGQGRRLGQGGVGEQLAEHPKAPPPRQAQPADRPTSALGRRLPACHGEATAAPSGAPRAVSEEEGAFHVLDGGGGSASAPPRGRVSPGSSQAAAPSRAPPRDSASRGPKPPTSAPSSSVSSAAVLEGVRSRLRAEVARSPEEGIRAADSDGSD